VQPTPSTRIADEIRRQIASGELRAGSRAPSTRQITRKWGVAMATASRVLAKLREEGLVRAVPGAGTVVEPAPGSAPVRPRAPRLRSSRPAEHDVTQEHVVSAAMAIADAEGLAALSMRRIAADLGIPTMSLYRYVPAKDELVLMMADAAIGELRFPDPPPRGWRAQLEVAARLQWAGYKRHPWLPPVISLTRPQLLPNGMKHTEWSLRAVDGLGLDANARLHVALTLFGFVRGTAVNLEPETEAALDTGLDNEQWMESQEAALEELLKAGSFPQLARVTGESIELDLDTLFEFGLRRLLDGLGELVQLSRPT
jgi:DNA-binding transcriptional regulator YhcF (GntR family)